MLIESVMPSNHLILCHPLSPCLQSFPASSSFPVSQLFEPGGQSIGASALASVPPVNIHGWFPGFSGLISLLSRLLSRVFSNTTVPKHQFFGLVYRPTLTSIQDAGKTIALTTWTFVGKVMFLLFNTLSRFAMAFLPRGKCLLISWMQFLFLESKKIKSVTVFIFSPIYHEVMGWDGMPWSSFFQCWVLSQVFLLSFTSSRGSLVPLHFLP